MLIRPRPATGVLLVLCSSCCFAVNATMSKLILLTGVDATQLTAVRATGAAAGLFLLAALNRPARLRLTAREVPLLLGYGLAGFFFVPLLYFVTIRRLPVGVGLLLEYTAPLLVVLWLRLVHRQQVRRRLWLGLAVSLAGLACVAEVIRIGPGPRLTLDSHLRLDGVGVAAGLGAAALLAAYYLLGARGVARRDTLSLTAYAFGVAAVAGALIRPWWNFDPAPFTAVTAVGLPVWLVCCYVVVGGSIAAYLLVAASLRHLPATSVGIIAMVEPVIAAAIAWLVLGERLSPGQLGGGALILAGVALAETARVTAETARVTAGPVGGAGPVVTAGPVGGAGPASRADGPARQDGTMQLHTNAQAVQDALAAAGAVDSGGQPCRVHVLPDAVHTAVAAAAALNVEVGQIANSLVFTTGDSPLLVLTSGAHRVDTARVAGLLGVGAVRRATPDFVREHTGQVIGGVAPLGHPAPVQTLVDTALAQYTEIWAAGGIPQAVFPITYDELVRITSGTPAEVA